MGFWIGVILGYFFESITGNLFLDGLFSSGVCTLLYVALIERFEKY